MQNKWDKVEEVRTRYRQERPLYRAVAEEVKERLEQAIKKSSVKAMCSAREKELDSLVKKAMADKYLNPYEDIHDKAGVRILLVYADDLPTVQALIDELFQVESTTDKTRELRERRDTLGYHGFHYEVLLGETLYFDLAGDQYDLGQCLCEIQIQTRAQNVWNDVSHEHLYKPFYEVPPALQHDVYRLVALMEIFDDELVRLRQALGELPESAVGKLLHSLERQYLCLTSIQYDSALSMEMTTALASLLPEEVINNFDQVIADFIGRSGQKLEDIYRRRFQDQESPLMLFQPESILIFDLLEKDRFLLKDFWQTEFPINLLQEMADVWSVAI